MKFLAQLWRDESGTTAIEYGLIVVLIVIGGISATISIGTSVTSSFNNVATHLGR